MIGKKMQKALNDQVNAEMYSSYLYLSMNTWFQSQNLPGCANWMRVQAQEEMTHAMKIYDYIHERGGQVTLNAIDKPPAKWDSPVAVFEAVCKHEQKVTGLIDKLVDLAITEKDHASNSFLQWFVDEQVEEEASADEVLQKIKAVQKAPGGMFMMDRELGQRIFAPPAEKGE